MEGGYWSPGPGSQDYFWYIVVLRWETERLSSREEFPVFALTVLAGAGSSACEAARATHSLHCLLHPLTRHATNPGSRGRSLYHSLHLIIFCILLKDKTSGACAERTPSPSLLLAVLLLHYSVSVVVCGLSHGEIWWLIKYFTKTGLKSCSIISSPETQTMTVIMLKSPSKLQRPLRHVQALLLLLQYSENSLSLSIFSYNANWSSCLHHHLLDTIRPARISFDQGQNSLSETENGRKSRYTINF